jgi:hypothetical protein
MGIKPHVAEKIRNPAIDRRTARNPGCVLSQRHRKKIEEPYGWAKTVGGNIPDRSLRARQGPCAVHGDNGGL